MIRTHVITVRCGYVENCVVPVLIFHHAAGFENRVDALSDLALSLYNHYYENSIGPENGIHRITNCNNNVVDDYGRCTVCKRNIKPTYEGFCNYLAELNLSTNDSFGGEIYGSMWWPFDGIAPLFMYQPSSILSLKESAEQMIVAAINPSKINDDFFISSLKNAEIKYDYDLLNSELSIIDATKPF